MEMDNFKEAYYLKADKLNNEKVLFNACNNKTVSTNQHVAERNSQGAATPHGRGAESERGSSEERARSEGTNAKQVCGF